ncbi:hypothetical protein L1887_35863 [Cichorium endivia]|nr:hypothetical protein L1887_35863 [Cichorium endivia]
MLQLRNTRSPALLPASLHYSHDCTSPPRSLFSLFTTKQKNAAKGSRLEWNTYFLTPRFASLPVKTKRIWGSSSIFCGVIEE